MINMHTISQGASLSQNKNKKRSFLLINIVYEADIFFWLAYVDVSVIIIVWRRKEEEELYVAETLAMCVITALVACLARRGGAFVAWRRWQRSGVLWQQRRGTGAAGW